MASIHREPGKPHWFCFYYGADGRRKHKSTKTGVKSKALVICAAMDRAAKKARQSTLSPERAREIIEDAVSDIMENSGQVLPHASIGDYLKSWVKEKEAVSSAGTFARYDGIIKVFLAFLGARTRSSLTALTVSDVQAFRDHLMPRVSTSTVNVYLKVLRVALGRAVKAQVISTNPAALVENLKVRNKGRRRAFTLGELQKLIGAADPEWRVMIVCGLYTGLRLQDIAGLTWRNVDLAEKQISVETGKTGRQQLLPMHPTLLSEIEKLPAGDDPAAPLLPGLNDKPSAWLSNQFYDLMSSVGLVTERNHEKNEKGKGRDMRRKLNEVSFHALRPTATSLLKNAGVSDVVARDIIGHESEAISRNYTHIDESTKRAAIAKMPDILK